MFIMSYHFYNSFKTSVKAEISIKTTLQNVSHITHFSAIMMSPITAQISCTCTQGSAIPLATFVFNSQEPWVIVLDCTEKPRR